MKILLLLLITTYAKTMSPILKNFLGVRVFCRFKPTCSEYARVSIQKYGFLRGFVLFAKRIIRCQPFCKG